MAAKKPSSKTVSRQATAARKHELELERLKQRGETERIMMKYVMEDFRSQLLIAALTGTAAAAVMEKYKEYVTGVESENESLPEAEKKPPIALLYWLLTGGGGGLLGAGFAAAFDMNLLSGMTASNPYSFLSNLSAAAKDTSGMCWAALFACIIMGDGGLGGIISSISGAGGGAVSGLAAATGV